MRYKILQIDERMYILDLMQFRFAESIENADILENTRKFNRLCRVSRIDLKPLHMLTITHVYAVNVVLECLRDGVGNGIWPKDVNYDLITSVGDRSVEKYYDRIVLEKRRLIKIACDEIEMVRGLIHTNVHKYENIIKGAGEMDIYSLDHACVDIGRTIGYIRKGIIKIPSIVEKNRYDMIKEIERRTEEKRKKDHKKREKKQEKLRRRIAIENFLDKEHKKMNEAARKKVQQKYQSDNTNKIMVSQDFGGNK